MRVLVVDDMADMRSLVRAALERAGHVVVGEASDGRDAVDLAGSHQPDAVILDAMMPELDGFGALPGLRAALPTARIVMFSSLPDEGERALAAGASSYVEKADGVRALIEVLQST